MASAVAVAPQPRSGRMRGTSAAHLPIVGERVYYFVGSAASGARQAQGTWYAGAVAGVAASSVTVTSDDGETVRVNPEDVLPGSFDASSGVGEMTALDVLHEASVLENLCSRYARNEVYTRIGSVVVALNPYQTLNIYGPDAIERYDIASVDGTPLPPHIYELAARASERAVSTTNGQAILISGESGAGKTESTRLILRFLCSSGSSRSRATSAVTRERAASAVAAENVEKQVLESNPFLEAFGNAKTRHNHNSSRFGKYMTLRYRTESGRIAAAQFDGYLLERSRSASPPKGERSFHIFYQLTKSAHLMAADDAAQLKLQSASKHRLTSMSGCVDASGIDDQVGFANTVKSMEWLGFKAEEQLACFAIASAVLHMGDIAFVEMHAGSASGAATVDAATKPSLESAARLLGLDSSSLLSAMTSKTFQGGRRASIHRVELGVRGAGETRDALMKAVYGALFRGCITRLNMATSSGEVDANQGSAHTVSILDVFGFEDNEIGGGLAADGTTNGFEQMTINYANERLHTLFNRDYLASELAEFEREGISMKLSDDIISDTDNSPCLKLFDARPLGMWSLLEEECRISQGTDEGLVMKLMNNVGKHSHFKESRFGGASKFAIVHFAGTVEYAAEGMVDKNRDEVPADLRALLQSTSSEFLQRCLESAKLSASDGPPGAKKVKTVATEFQAQLDALIKGLRERQLHYVRCLRPNMLGKPNTIDGGNLLRQLRAAGLADVCRVRRSLAFDVRPSYDEFCKRWGGTSSKEEAESRRKAQGKTDVKGAPHHPLRAWSEKMLQEFGLTEGIDYALGRERIFLKDRSIFSKLQHRHLAAAKIQALFRGKLQRTEFYSTLRSVRNKNRSKVRERIDEIAKRLAISQKSLAQCTEKCEHISASLKACADVGQETAASATVRAKVAKQAERVAAQATDALAGMAGESDEAAAPLRASLKAAISGARALCAVALDDAGASPQLSGAGAGALRRAQSLHVECTSANAHLGESVARVSALVGALRIRCEGPDTSQMPSAEDLLDCESELTSLMEGLQRNHSIASECVSAADDHMRAAVAAVDGVGDVSKHARTLEEKVTQAERGVLDLIETSTVLVRYRKRCENLQSRIDELESTQQRLSKLSQEEAGSLQSELHDLRAQGASTEQLRSELDAKCRALEKELAQSKQMHRAVAHQLQTSEESLARINAEADKIRKAKGDAEHRLKRVETDLSEQANTALSLERKLNATTEAVSSSKLREEALQTRQTQLISEAEALKEQLRQTLVACAGLAEEATQKSSDLSRLNDDLSRREFEIAALREENARLRALLEERENQIISLGEELEALRLGTSEAMAELEGLRQLDWNEMGELRNENRKLRVANALLSQGEGGALYRRWYAAELERRQLFELFQPEVRVIVNVGHALDATQFEKGIGSIVSLPNADVGTVRVHLGEHQTERSRRGTIFGEGGTAHEDFDVDDVFDLDAPKKKQSSVWNVLKPYARLLADGKSSCVVWFSGGVPSLQEDLLFGQGDTSVAAPSAAADDGDADKPVVTAHGAIHHFLLEFLRHRAMMVEAGWTTTVQYCMLDVDADRLEDALSGGPAPDSVNGTPGRRGNHHSAARTRVHLRPERVDEVQTTKTARPRHEDAYVAAHGRLMPDGATWVTIETDEDAREAAERFWRACHACAEPDLMHTYRDPSVRARVAQRLGCSFLPPGSERGHVVFWLDFTATHRRLKLSTRSKSAFCDLRFLPPRDEDASSPSAGLGSPGGGDAAAHRRRRQASVRRSTMELGQTLANRWRESTGGGRRCELTRVLGEVMYEPRRSASGTAARTGDKASTKCPKCLVVASIAKGSKYERNTLHALRYASAARLGSGADVLSAGAGARFLREQWERSLAADDARGVGRD